MHITRLLMAAATAVGLASSIGAHSSEAAPAVMLGGGSGILMSHGAICSVAAIGHDGGGHLVALTAAHCADEAEPLSTLVGSEQMPSAGVIGQIASENAVLDYAVIQLDPAKVIPTRTVGLTTITGVGSFPAPGGTVCDDGRTTGFGCGPVLMAYKFGTMLAYACAGPGDSGGPVTMGDKVVGMVNAGLTYGVLPSCDKSAGLHAPLISRPMDAIMQDLNSRNVIGSGFRPF